MEQAVLRLPLQAHPMAHFQWLQTSEFAELAGISRQAAAKAVRLTLSGGLWRDGRLEVRRVPGRGGRQGTTYQIAFESLPSKLRQSSAPLSVDDGWRSNRTTSGNATVATRLATISPALEQARGSGARALAIARTAIQSSVSERTLYRWVDRYETYGIRGLARSKPNNAGERRVVVSRDFDRGFLAASGSLEQLRALATQLQQAIKGLWASRAEAAGVTEVRRLAEFRLIEICEAQGFTIPRTAIRLSRPYVERFAHYRVVNQRKNDRKAFNDVKPRIRRDWTALEPMERVVADVKHLDVIVRRADGTTAWPKIVAFLDAGTGRIFAYPVLLDKGEGVRQEHVIEAFLSMVAEPAWGFPQGLYLDNGSEFAALTKIDHALQLINEAGARTIIFAQPYNAAAKPIESVFARLDRYVFSLLPGYAGPDRTATKRQTLGKPPEPYPGTWDEFCQAVKGLIAAYNQRPISGLWRGRSPDDWTRSKINSGWRTATVAPTVLDAAFADHESRRIDRGIVKIKGTRFTHLELSALPARTVVDLALPWRREAAPLVRIEGRWIYLHKDVAYPARWIEGARETGRRQSAQSRYVRSLARDAGLIDPVALKIRSTVRTPPLPASHPRSQLDLGEELGDLAAVNGIARSERQTSEIEKRRARDRALTERLERKQKSDG